MADSTISTKKRGTGINAYWLVSVGGAVVGHHATKAAAAKQVMYLKRARKLHDTRSNPQRGSLPVGKFVKVQAVRQNRDGSVTVKLSGRTAVRKAPAKRKRR